MVLHRAVVALIILDLVWLLSVDLPAFFGGGPNTFLVSKSWVESCILRPVILVALALLVRATVSAVSERFRSLTSTALLAAAVVELLQNVGPLVDLPTLGVVFLGIATAAPYGLYIGAFFSLGGRPTGRAWLPFPLVAAYAALMFWILTVFARDAEVVLTAAVYIVAVTALVGSACLRLLRGETTNSALLTAAGALLLLVSDSVRAISVFKFSNPFALSEFLILALFFAGQYSLAASVRSDSGTAPPPG